MTIENCPTVFYVDDNPKSSRLITSVLQQCGFRVISTQDPIEAFVLSKKIAFDLVLLDYDMPGMSGSQLAQKIKSTLPNVPIVLISGYAALPPTELLFVDAHFGLGTVLDDLLWSMRTLAEMGFPQGQHNHLGNSAIL
jgi:CheY-like chemotaxis protein